MNKETYEALKRLVEFYHDNDRRLFKGDIEQVESWIDEVSKEYTEDDERYEDYTRNEIRQGRETLDDNLA